MADTTDRAVTEWLERYVAETLQPDALDRLTLRVNGEIMAGIPQIAADEELQRDLDASTRSHGRALLGALVRDRFEVRLPPEASDLARTIARRRLELGILLKIYRLGQRAAWRYITEVVDERTRDEGLKSAVLVHFWEHVSEWIDTSIESLITTYTEERERWLRGALARRAETVHAILRGDAIDVDEAGGLLGHPLRRHQTAFVLWADDCATEPEVTSRLETLANTLASTLGAPRALTLPSGARGLWAWVATDREPDLRTLAHLRALRASEGLRVAVGTTAYGLSGFRHSHREALSAQRVAVHGRHDRPLTCYTDVELVCLLSGDAEAMRALITRELAGLAEADPATERLRETVRLFLAHGGNTHTAGRVLGVHKNTVRYRVRQAEELLGHGLDERRLHLELALMCVDAYGDTVLPGRQ